MEGMENELALFCNQVISSSRAAIPTKSENLQLQLILSVWCVGAMEVQNLCEWLINEWTYMEWYCTHSPTAAKSFKIVNLFKFNANLTASLSHIFCFMQPLISLSVLSWMKLAFLNIGYLVYEFLKMKHELLFLTLMMLETAMKM